MNFIRISQFENSKEKVAAEKKYEELRLVREDNLSKAASAGYKKVDPEITVGANREGIMGNEITSLVLMGKIKKRKSAKKPAKKKAKSKPKKKSGRRK